MTIINTYDGLYDVSYIETMEELEAVFMGSVREVTGCVVHHTHTFRDQIITADDIHREFVDAGAEIPYHFIILQDGTLQRGRPINKAGQHAADGHNDNTIGVAFVGGLNLYSTNQQQYGGFEAIINDARYNTSDGFSATQWKTFDAFCKTLIACMPHIQIYGHKDINQAVLDPGFNVARYIKQKFEKQLIINPTDRIGTYNDLLALVGA